MAAIISDYLNYMTEHLMNSIDAFNRARCLFSSAYFYLEQIKVLKAGSYALNIFAWNNGKRPRSYR